MLPQGHFLLSLLLIPFLLKFFDFKIIMIFILANVLIDLDHYFIYGIKFKDWNLFNTYRFFASKQKGRSKKYYLCIFHSLEFLSLFALITLLSKDLILISILSGFLFHCFIDLIYAILVKDLSIRTFSLIAHLRRT